MGMFVFTTYSEVLPDLYFFDFIYRGLVIITKKKLLILYITDNIALII